MKLRMEGEKKQSILREEEREGDSHLADQADAICPEGCMHFSLVWMLEDCALASAHTALSGVYANTSPAASPPRAVAVALRSLSAVVACENCEHHSCHFPSWKDLNKGQEFQFEGVRSGNLMLRRGVDTLRISPRPPCPCTEMLGFANS